MARAPARVDKRVPASFGGNAAGARESPSISVKTSRWVKRCLIPLVLLTCTRSGDAKMFENRSFYGWTFKIIKRLKVCSRRAPAQLQDHRLFARRSINVQPIGPMSRRRPETEWAPAGTGTMVRPLQLQSDQFRPARARFNAPWPSSAQNWRKLAFWLFFFPLF